MAIKTAWALRDNNLVNINQINRDTERGSKCGCICVSCGSQLVARMGDHKAHHFAHNSDQNCSLESIQHQLAKLIISQSVSCSITTAYSNPIYKQFSYQVSLKNVELEKPLAGGQIIADCFVNEDSTKASRPFAIEIFYTNKKDSVHVEQYLNLGIPALEIDVSGMDLHLSWNELRDFVLHDAPREWLKMAPATSLSRQMEDSDPDTSSIYESWITADGAIDILNELFSESRLYDFVGAIGKCGESTAKRREKIAIQSIDGVIESTDRYVLVRGYVAKNIPVDILVPLDDFEAEAVSPTLVVDLDYWGEHHSVNWSGIDKWKRKLQFQADQDAEKKEQKRLNRLAAKDNELTIEQICKWYKQSSSLSDFYAVLADQTGLDLSNLPFMSRDKIMTNWNCPRAIWRAIILLVFVRQGQKLECDMIGYEMFINDAFGCDYRFTENRSKEVYFWLEKHYQALGARRNRLTYQFYKSKLPKNFDSMMIDMINS
ncbi:competence protein CoiA family protein [Vibrio jasicida]|uniref:competence protein CoiA family protein n=1 Tax=Vibrio jasicida TaxID=766224 RepID=UPI004068CF8A